MQSHSQAGQDCFPRFLVKHSPGTYLDIGCHAPTVLNNSYILEKEGWTGVSIDIQDFSHAFQTTRRNRFLQADATTVQWEPIFAQCRSSSAPGSPIHYLSFDIDDATEAAFRRFPWDSQRFSTITIEHDQYRVGTRMRDTIRSKLISIGYSLVCADVIVPGYGAFEDWYIDPDPNHVYLDRVESIRCAFTPFQDILNKMKV